MNTTLPLAEVKVQLKQEASTVEAWLAACLNNHRLLPSLPQGLREAMSYSLLAGGKRIRPVLCLVTARLFGTPCEAVLPFAAAIECIHTYSLIHDDLPAMDNDDLRRGKPSNHKQFSEATAILAGDGLLTDAFAFMASCRTIPAEKLLDAIAELAKAAGSSGMVGGQFLDMDYTTTPCSSLEDLAFMHALKTGAMLKASCTCGAILGGASQKNIARLESFGTAIGAAFQIMDDILDITSSEEELGKPQGSDAAANKTTYPSLLGLKRSKDMAVDQANKAILSLQPYSGPEAALLRGLAEYIVNRVS